MARDDRLFNTVKMASLIKQMNGNFEVILNFTQTYLILFFNIVNPISALGHKFSKTTQRKVGLVFKIKKFTSFFKFSPKKYLNLVLSNQLYSMYMKQNLTAILDHKIIALKYKEDIIKHR